VNGFHCIYRRFVTWPARIGSHIPDILLPRRQTVGRGNSALRSPPNALRAIHILRHGGPAASMSRRDPTFSRGINQALPKDFGGGSPSWEQDTRIPGIKKLSPSLMLALLIAGRAMSVTSKGPWNSGLRAQVFRTLFVYYDSAAHPSK
jgi:hypothetical protein